MIDILQKFGTQHYYHQENAIRKLPEFLADYHIRHPLVVHGEASWKAAEKYWPEDPEFDYTEFLFAGECSFNEIDRMCAFIALHEFDGIIGLGGGKVLDTVKGAAAALDLKSVLIPTLPSNCACFTPLSIMYSDEGLHLHTIRHQRSSSLVLVEPQLLAEAPVEHLVSGIGDTLAKWYENRVSFQQLPDEEKTVPVELGQSIAKKCAENIASYGGLAHLAAKQKKANDAFSKILDTIFYLAGLVGGTSAKYGQSAGAHAFFYAHTDLQIEKGIVNQSLHGAVVAYGILVQLSLQQAFDDIAELVPLYQQLSLPSSIKELNIQEDADELEKLVNGVLKPGSYIYKINKNLSKSAFIAAIQELETFVLKRSEPSGYFDRN